MMLLLLTACLCRFVNASLEVRMFNASSAPHLEERRLPPLQFYRQGLCRLHGKEVVQTLNIAMLPYQRAFNYIQYKGEFGIQGQEPAQFIVTVEDRLMAVQFSFPKNLAPLPASYLVRFKFNKQVAAKDIGDNGWWFDTKPGYITTCSAPFGHTIGAITG